MKITVSYAELRSDQYNNKRAEASIEVEVQNGNIRQAYEKAWNIVREQVQMQLRSDVSDERYQQLSDMVLPY